MTEELKIKVRLDTSELKNGVKQIKDTLKNTSSEFGDLEKSTKSATSNTSQMTAAMKGLGAMSMAQTGLIVMSMTKVNKSTQLVRSNMRNVGEELRNMFNFKNFDVGKDGIKGYLESMKIQLKEAGVSAKLLAKNLSPLLTAAFDKLKWAVAGAVSAIGATIVAFSHLSESTREFRQAMNQVNTSFIALGSNAETAEAAYEAFYRILGDVQRSTEAANLLAQITTEEKNLVTWTKIATGAMAMFPDSLPTESLIEAANETIKTAKVTGTLADALNWPADAANKISKALEGSAEAQSIFNKAISQGMTTEDAFNQVLAETNNETQREVILRSALNGIYSESAGLYEEMNRELIKQNEAQNRLNQVMAKLGQITQPVQTAFTNFKATLANALAPAIKVICDWLVTLINWLTTAAAWLGAFLAVIFPGAAEKISSAFNSAASSVNKTTSGTTGLKEGLEEAEGTAQKLRRTLMGFDELNVVSKMDTSGSGASAGSGGAGAGDGIDVSGLDTGDSVFKKAQEQMEEMKEKIKAFLDEFKTEISIIAGALGLLGLANMLDHLGKAIGLGEKFHGIMTNIKKLAATAITIVLQYSLVNEFMDNYIDGEGFKEYLKGLLVAAIGTGILYAMWGPTGLVIGLAVTAVASLKAVIDNGGITNAESGVVALTGIATAIGAIAAAWKTFNIGAFLGEFGAFIALLKEGAGLGPTLAAAFPGIAGALSTVGTALSTFFGSVGAIFGATGTGAVVVGAGIIAAAIAGITGVIIYLKENWDAVVQAFKDWFADNIAPKLDGIRDSFIAIKDALVGVGEAVWNALPESWRDFLVKVGEAIRDIVAAIGEWFASIEWLEAIGAVFEFIGGVIFNAVSGVILGAINTLVGIFEGAAKALEGAVKIISGVIELVVSLFTLDLPKAGEACKKIFDGIVDVFTGLYDATIGAVIDFVEGVIDWFVKLWDELVGHSIVPDMIDDIVQCFKDLPGKVWTWLKELVNGVIKYFADMWTNVKKTTADKLTEIKNAMNTRWQEIKSWFNTNVAPKFTKQYWMDKFESIRKGAADKLTEVKNAINTRWNELKAFFNTHIAPKFTLDYWKKKFENIRKGLADKLADTKSAIQTRWNEIKGWFNTNIAPKFTLNYWKNKFQSIPNGMKSAFNGVIGIVEKAVNQIIKKINTLSWKIPDWVPGVGGKSFGFNFKTISIPRLAEGGITMGSTLANIGENGREAVLPLDNNTGWMDKLADRIATRSSAPTKVVLKVGERELGYAVIDAINKNTKQTGGLKLQLV